MGRMLGLSLLLAASAADAEEPVASNFALPQIPAVSRPPAELGFKFESPKVDYSEPARPERKQGFLAAVRVTTNGFLGIGMSQKKPQRSAMGPDPMRDGRRGGKKLALKYVLNF